MLESTFLNEIEADLFRARSLLAGLRLITEKAELSAEELGGAYLIACEAETAAEAAVTTWRRAHILAGGRDHG